MLLHENRLKVEALRQRSDKHWERLRHCFSKSSKSALFLAPWLEADSGQASCRPKSTSVKKKKGKSLSKSGNLKGQDYSQEVSSPSFKTAIRLTDSLKIVTVIFTRKKFPPKQILSTYSKKTAEVNNALFLTVT